MPAEGRLWPSEDDGGDGDACDDDDAGDDPHYKEQGLSYL